MNENEKAVMIELRDECLKYMGMIEGIRYQIDLLEDIDVENVDEDEWDKTVGEAGALLYDGQQVLKNKLSYYDQVLSGDTGLIGDE